MENRGIFLGRFNPIHIGHIKTIEHLLENSVTELIIAIGSANVGFTLENPLTGGERVEMIRIAINEAKIPFNSIFIIPITDIWTNPVYPGHLISLCPRFRVIYSNNPLIKLLFQQHRIEVINPGFFEREKFSSSSVRHQMITSQKWKNLVTPKVAEFLEKLKIPQRIQHLAKVNHKGMNKTAT